MNNAILALVGLLFLLSIFGCASKELIPGSEMQLTGEKRPDWVFDPTTEDSQNLKAFVGVSHDFKMEGDARSDALKDARQQIIDFMGVLGKRALKEAIVTSGVSSDIINPAVVKKEESELLSESYIKTRARNYHVERWQRVLPDKSVENYYKVYTLVKFDERDTQKYLKEAFQNARQTATSTQQQQLIQKAEDLLNGKSLFDE